MGVVKVNNLLVYGNHGCLDEESVIGSDYSINIKAWGETNKAAKTDCLEDAIDYVVLADVAAQQMKVRSKLLENVVHRIIEGCFESCPRITKIKVTLSKINPPINADVKSVCVSIKKKQKKRTGK
jgi:dihydroneopterin aldolase